MLTHTTTQGGAVASGNLSRDAGPFRRKIASRRWQIDQFSAVGGDSSRRLPENGRKIGDWSRLLQFRFEKLIDPAKRCGLASTAADIMLE
jgi:hypothetical protein